MVVDSLHHGYSVLLGGSRKPASRKCGHVILLELNARSFCRHPPCPSCPFCPFAKARFWSGAAGVRVSPKKKLPVKWSQFISGSRDEGFLRNPWMTPHSTSFTKIIIFMPGEYIYCHCRSQTQSSLLKKGHWTSLQVTCIKRNRGHQAARHNLPKVQHPQSHYLSPTTMCWPCEISQPLRENLDVQKFLALNICPSSSWFLVAPPKFRISNEWMPRCWLFQTCKNRRWKLESHTIECKAIASIFLNLNILASQVRIFHSFLICSCSRRVLICKWGPGF